MTRFPNSVLAGVTGLSLSLVSVVHAADHDGAKPLVVLGEDRLLVEIDGETLDCGLVRDGETARLDDCKPGKGPEAAASILDDLSSEEWQGAIRETLLDADCKLSAFGAVADVIEQAAQDTGIAQQAIESFREQLNARAEEAIDQMLRDGSLTVRDGELALDRCK